ncbi:MAG: hypothetical protein VB092_08705 [Oscillospiraceae bacterium]|nr:hypothetical protein [Oscillospiraceae bacterium]
MRKWITHSMLTGIVIGALTLSGCGSTAQKAPESVQPSAAQEEKEAADEALSSGPYWRIEASDTKNFTYTIPNGNGGAIDMTATLHFIAWKAGGEEMFGQYEGRALVAFDMDLSKAGTGGVTVMGGAMDDSISDNISFELIPAQQEAVPAEGEDIELAPLAKFIGQAEIITDEYTISQQNWKALADGQIKLDVNGSFGDGAKNAQGFVLKAGEDTVLISVGDFAAAYNLDAFRGTISKTEAGEDPRSWFRDKVMSRMEERLSSSSQSGDQQPPEAGSGHADAQQGFTVDSEGREGIDTNGDGRLEMYFDEDGNVYSDFDGDGKYEAADTGGVDH